jgi:hypothetical protein
VDKGVFVLSYAPDISYQLVLESLSNKFAALLLQQTRLHIAAIVARFNINLWNSLGELGYSHPTLFKPLRYQWHLWDDAILLGPHQQGLERPWRSCCPSCGIC